MRNVETKLSDRITQHAVGWHVFSARRDGGEILELRAGDVHKELGLRNRMPAVCGVLGSQKFQRVARVLLIDRAGPHSGANSTFTFKILH